MDIPSTLNDSSSILGQYSISSVTPRKKRCCICSLYKIQLPFYQITRENVYIDKMMIFWSAIHLSILAGVGISIFRRLGNVKQVLQYYTKDLSNQEIQEQYGAITPITDEHIKYGPRNSLFNFQFTIFEFDACQIAKDRRKKSVYIYIESEADTNWSDPALECYVNENGDSVFYVDREVAKTIYHDNDDIYSAFFAQNFAREICHSAQQDIDVAFDYGNIDINLNLRSYTSQEDFLTRLYSTHKGKLCTQSLGLKQTQVVAVKKILSKPFSYWKAVYSREEFYMTIDIELESIKMQTVYETFDEGKQDNFQKLENVQTLQFDFGNSKMTDVTQLKYYSIKNCLSDFGGFHTSLLLISSLLFSRYFAKQMLTSISMQIDSENPNYVISEMRRRLNIINIYQKLGEVEEIPIKEAENQEKIEDIQQKIRERESQIDQFKELIKKMDQKITSLETANQEKESQIDQMQRQNQVMEMKMNQIIQQIKRDGN